MNSWKVLAAVGAGLLALMLLGSLAFGRGGIRDHLDATYERTEPPPGALSETLAWRSSQGVDATADAIAAAVDPADRVDAEERELLAYRDAVVAVTPTDDGSVIQLDDEERGYSRWFFLIGPSWGRYYGPSGTFRGGGPGFGK